MYPKSILLAMLSLAKSLVGTSLSSISEGMGIFMSRNQSVCGTLTNNYGIVNNIQELCRICVREAASDDRDDALKKSSYWPAGAAD